MVYEGHVVFWHSDFYSRLVKIFCMHKIILFVTSLVFGCVAFGNRTLVHESFENTTGSYISALVGSSYSSNRPFAGAFHLLGETNQFSMTLQIPSNGSATSGFLLSCFIDPKSESKELLITFGDHKQSVRLENDVIGYRQVLVQLPYDGQVLPDLHLTVTGGGKHFLIDDLEIKAFGSPLPVRPEPTQIIANVNGVSEDMIGSLSLNGHSLDLFHGVSADGYSFMHDAYAHESNDEALLLQVEPSLTDVTYALGVWVDSNLNGIYEESERISTAQVTGRSTVVLPTTLFNGAAVPVRVRLLDKRVTNSMTALSGNTWGQTLDLLIVEAADLSKERCSCASPDHYLDLSGKKISTLDGVPAGIYFKACGTCLEKVIVTK